MINGGSASCNVTAATDALYYDQANGNNVLSSTTTGGELRDVKARLAALE